MFPGDTLAFSHIAREKNCDGVQRRAGETDNSLVGTIPTRIAEHFGTCRHALLKFFGKRCK